MDLLVQDIIKLYPLSRARLLAGKSGLMRTVASANIQEVPNVERWLRRGEVLFTAGYAFRELEDRPSLSSPGSICRRSPGK